MSKIKNDDYHKNWLNGFLKKRGLGENDYFVLDDGCSQTVVGFKSKVNKILKVSNKKNVVLWMFGNNWELKLDEDDPYIDSIELKQGVINRNYNY